MNKIKYFISSIDILIGKAFLYSQSRFSQIVKDILKSKIRSLSESFSIVKGKAGELPEIETTNLKVPTRGNGAVNYSAGYEFDKIPKVFQDIIDKHSEEIRNYLGDDFLFEPAIVFRNFTMPKGLLTFDVYSNIWHQDSHDGNRLLKIFVLPNKVTEKDGPFYYLDEFITKKYWTLLRERWDWGKMKCMPQFDESNILLGDKSDYLILDTSRCMHRASNPEDIRDMMQIALYPSWRKNSDREIYGNKSR